MKACDILQKRDAITSLDRHRVVAQSEKAPSKKNTITDDTLLEMTLVKASADPRFTGWSVQAKCIFLYLTETIPKFKAAHLINTYVDTGLQTEFPELWAKVSSHPHTKNKK